MEPIDYPAALREKDDMWRAASAAQRNITDELDRRSGLVLNAYDNLTNTLMMEPCINDNVRAAHAKFLRVCAVVSGVTP